MRQSGIAAAAYHKLKERLGLPTPTRAYDVYQMLADFDTARKAGAELP